MALKKGSIINNKYWIIEPIKSGGMGAVYKAADMHFQERIVAVKEMLQEFSSEDTVELVKRKFREEANVLAKLKHKGIPQVIDYFIENNVYYIVMEYIEGENLEKILQQYLALTGKPVPEILMTEYAIQICEILEYLHGWKPNPFIHRDIKPGNIVLRKLSKEVVLVDFGLARRISEDSFDTNTLVGTVGYAPIEQFKGHPEPRSDIYALGATMHHLLTGEKPKPLSVEPIEMIKSDINADLAKIVNKATNEEPRDRFSSAQEMKEALIEVLPVLKEQENSNTHMLKSKVKPEHGDDEKQTQMYIFDRDNKFDGQTNIDKMIPYKPERFEKERLEIFESPLWKSPVFQAITIFLVLVGIISVISSILNYKKEMNYFSIFHKDIKKKAFRNWKCIYRTSDVRKCKDRDVISLGFSTDNLKGVGRIVFKRKENAKRYGEFKSIEFNLNINGYPDLLVFWGRYGILFTDVKKMEDRWRNNWKLCGQYGILFSGVSEKEFSFDGYYLRFVMSNDFESPLASSQEPQYKEMYDEENKHFYDLLLSPNEINGKYLIEAVKTGLVKFEKSEKKLECPMEKEIPDYFGFIIIEKQSKKDYVFVNDFITNFL